jgi:small subunit ribosomal protein S7
MKKVSPLVEVRGRRVGGANYQVPFQVKGDRRFYLGCKWLIEVTKNKKGKAMAERLANEILEASEDEGMAVRKRENVHKMAESNKAFAHFAR